MPAATARQYNTIVVLQPWPYRGQGERIKLIDLCNHPQALISIAFGQSVQTSVRLGVISFVLCMFLFLDRSLFGKEFLNFCEVQFGTSPIDWRAAEI